MKRNGYKAAIPIVSGIAYVRNGGSGVATSGLPWCDGDIDRQPRRDAPKQGNKVFWLTGRIWVEEEALELFIHSHPNRDGSWTEGEFVKCRVLMLHDPDRLIKERNTPRYSDQPIPLRGGAKRSEGDAHTLVGLPGSSFHAYAMTTSPTKLYHAASRDSAEHIARRGITSGDYGKGKLVWASLTPQGAVVAFLQGHPVPRSEVDVYEIDMSGIPNVSLEYGYPLSAMLEKMADFFDAPHIREMGKAAKRMAAAGGFYEDSRIIEGGVSPDRVRPVPKTNPTDLAGRNIPERYLAGLPPALQKQRIRELTESRAAYHRGDFSELPTDVTARKMGLVKQSAYTTVAKERGVEWRGDPTDMATRILIKYGHRPTPTDVRKLSEALRKVFSKGLAAWKSGGHRPGATAQNWAVARVNSVAVGGKAAWSTDSRQFEAMPEKVQRTIQDRLDEVMSALHAQGRQRDVAYLAVAKSGVRNNPVTEVEARRRLGSLLYPLIFRAITLQVASISRNTSSNITMQAKQELVQGAFEKAIQTVFDSVMYDEDSFSADNPQAEENLAEAAGLAKSVATKYIIDNARREVDPRAKTRQDEKADIDSTRRSLSILLGRAPTVEELAARLGRTADELQTIMGTRLLQIKHVGDTVRVRPQRSARLQEEQSGTGVLEVELIPDETIREREEQKEQMAQLQEAIEGLEPGERQIVRAYLGEIPARSLPYGPDELKRMVEGGYNQRTKSRDPGLMGKLATIVEERRLIEEKGVPRGRLVAR